MQLRTSTSQHWQALKEEERKLTIEVVQDRATISRMLKDERHQAQNREMDACLVEIANDDPVVLLAIEEWHEKLHALDKSHEATCKQLEDQKMEITRAYEEEIFLKQEEKERNTVLSEKSEEQEHEHPQKGLQNHDWKHVRRRGRGRPEWGCQGGE